MKLKIEGCTCCGFCACIWRDWFYIDSEGHAHTKDVDIPEDRIQEVRNCIAQCVGEAISVVEE